LKEWSDNFSRHVLSLPVNATRHYDFDVEAMVRDGGRVDRLDPLVDKRPRSALLNHVRTRVLTETIAIATAVRSKGGPPDGGNLLPGLR
jgi:hypothetical protein